MTLIAVPLVGACGPDVYRGDPADAAFDTEVGYGECGSWGLPTSVEWGLFDLFVGYTGGGPTAEDLQRIHEAGGLVVHEFALPIVRAVVRPKDLRLTGAYRAHGVMRPDQYPVTLHVRIASPEGVFEPDDEARQRDLLESLGGEQMRVSQYHASGNLWEVTLPDHSIPPLRAREDVLELRLPVYGCLDGP